MTPHEEYWKETTGLCDYLFDSIDDVALGFEVPSSGNGADERRCFNCGSTSHVLTSCPSQRNEPLIALSRALFNFTHTSSGEPERVHVAIGRRARRLLWLDEFAPGEIRGSLLRDALGLRDDDAGEYAPWLKQMLKWGYPKGWTGERDPRHQVQDRILYGFENGDDGEEEDAGELWDDDDFVIFGDWGTEEPVNLAKASVWEERPPAWEANSRHSVNEHDNDSGSDTESTTSESTENTPIRRWATYKTTLFSNTLLPIYFGTPLPALQLDYAAGTSSTYTPDREALWLRIISGNASPSESKNGGDIAQSALEGGRHGGVRPWRWPGAFSAFGPVGWKPGLSLPRESLEVVHADGQPSPVVFPGEEGHEDMDMSD
ncbi:hypothetical protein BD410DRAFT_896486 [Rickenella mellea]|uniref:CCHC-type domain-containing protein n=1 Tax=Rickenella mellea TaxID=50990 RepID=A0A4Y7QB34_9AGAM|nr:hypothetical protein BD410DRAFT_896486 [Rickenella mellea]